MPQPLLEVINLKKYFTVNKGLIKKTIIQIKAVDGIGFTVQKGETLGLVGESGCGKSTAGRVILGLLQATGGEVCFQGSNIHHMGRQGLRQLRGEMQLLFQDPYASLNPRMTVRNIVGEALDVHGTIKGTDRTNRVLELLDMVRLPVRHINKYPHQFSGGERQRLCMARALAVEPKLIVCDEPVSALDVSIQAQIINLMRQLQQQLGVAYVFISHDLGVIKHISDRVAVMYLGKIVELAPKNRLFYSPLHPYTQALLSAIPTVNPRYKRERILLEGEVPGPLNIPGGCRFHPRCVLAQPVCRDAVPELKNLGEGHFCACHRL